VQAAKTIYHARAKTLSRKLKGGRPPKDDRIVVTAIWYALRTGCPCCDMPERYGSWGSIYTRWRRWSASGLW